MGRRRELCRLLSSRSGPCCAARRAPDSTVRPAWSVRTRTDTPLSVRSDHYTCNICGNKGHWIQECPDKEARDAERAAARGGNRAPQKPISRACPPAPSSPSSSSPSSRADSHRTAADECWFCLSNPKVTKHLIASIGSETYVTLPKGQLCSTDSSPVPGGGHVLLIPVRRAAGSSPSRPRCSPSGGGGSRHASGPFCCSVLTPSLPAHLRRSRTTRPCARSPRTSPRPCTKRSSCTRRPSASATRALAPNSSRSRWRGVRARAGMPMCRCVVRAVVCAPLSRLVSAGPLGDARTAWTP